MEGQGLKVRLKGRFLAAFNKVTLKRRKKSQSNAATPRFSLLPSSRQQGGGSALGQDSQGVKSVPYGGKGNVDRTGESPSTASRGRSIACENGDCFEEPRSRGGLSPQAETPSQDAFSPQPISNSSPALVRHYVARALDQGVPEPARLPPHLESVQEALPPEPPNLFQQTEGGLSQPAEEAQVQEDSPSSSPNPLPEKDLNVLLCTVATHMWMAETLSELEMLSEMVDVLVRGGATEFLPAIIKGCWAASLSRSSVNLPQKVGVFSKMVKEGAQLLSPEELHEALRVASMACACVWADRETASRTAGGCPVRALLEVIRVLIRAGASNVNRVLRDVLSYKMDSVEVVRIFLREGGTEIDVNRALRHATACSSHVNVLRCLVKEGGASELSRPLMLAAINGFLPAVRLFLECGCTDSGSLYGALYCAVTAGQCELIAYLLGVLPPELGNDDLFELLKSASADESAVQGVIHLLRCNVMRSESLTIAAADSLASRQPTRLELRTVLEEDWTSEAYERGCEEGRRHELNFALAANKGNSRLRLRELPVELQVAVAYQALYEKCSASEGKLLPQRLKGHLVSAVGSLYCKEGWGDSEGRWTSKEELLEHLRKRLPK